MRRAAARGAAGLVALGVLVSAQIESPLRDAVVAGDTAAVGFLLGQGADSGPVLEGGNTPLHLAAEQGNGEIVALLLDAGANPDARNRYGVTPLVEAAANPSGPVTELLLRAGADPNTVTVGGETVLMTAARLGNVDAARALIEAGADVEATEDTRDQTPLMWAAGYSHQAMVRLLVDSGADVSTSDRVATPPAGGRGRGRGAPPLPVGGMTALMFAARQGSQASAEILVDAGADIDAGDAQGWTALMLAIRNTHYRLAEMLVGRGADPNRATPDGQGPLYTLVDMDTIMPSSASPIRPEMDDLSPLELAEVLLDAGADPNTRLAPAGSTPLHRAAEDANLPMMRLLIDRGADPLMTTADGHTLVMLLTGMGVNRGFGSIPYPVTEAERYAAIEFGLDQGVDINAANDGGDTVLHGGARAGDDTLVRFLAARGARLDATNGGGFTALNLASGLGAPPGRRGGPAAPVVHESTVALLQELLAAPVQ